ncbi:hypothetical protein JNE38_23235 [Brevibacillus choshinensis]|uniref:Ankyrin n=1 Tax=Brevibacillus choshinensis TaxID=54911 RepID=A0ABX7FYJ2_BRECH|nr:hypothetical protein [Brevibacillus choshinensis]QRG70860.1 hypothetical protein JNE38_23235 [Brevibacillus choshinensis]
MQHASNLMALIDAGADVNLQDDLLDNPFLYAGAEGLLEIVKLIWSDPTTACEKKRVYENRADFAESWSKIKAHSFRRKAL